MEELNEIPYYKDNPNMPLKTVTCFDGSIEYRKNCRKIGDLYYIKGQQCHLIDDVWFRVSSGSIDFDHAKNVWFVIKKITNDMTKGIVDYDVNKSSPKFGYFTKDPYNNVTVLYAGSEFPCISEQVAGMFAIEAPAKGMYINKVEHSLSDLRIKNFKNNQTQNYNCDDDLNLFNYTKELFDNFNFKISKGIYKYAECLGDITFGTELECIRGYLPEHIRNRTGTIICRDGSLRDTDESQGPEYTTVPYSGAKGISSLIYLSKEISKRNNINANCALHLHIGNIPTTRTFMVALYKLCYLIQDDLFKMFPYYKNNEVKFAGKNKNYCQKLTPIIVNNIRNLDKDEYHNYMEDSYLRIYKFLLEGSYPSRKYNRKNKRHPRQHKWDRHSRYYWVNFINLITSTRNTVEFRLHTATTNPQKIISWLFICNAIIKTALFRTNFILKNKPINIYDVLGVYSDLYKSDSARELSDYLIQYYEQRCIHFKNDFMSNDFLSEKDVTSDVNFKMECKPFTDIFN